MEPVVRVALGILAVTGVIGGTALYSHHWHKALPTVSQQNQAPELLWDFTIAKAQPPHLSEDLKKKIVDQIWPVTHTNEDVVFTSSVRGAFYPGVPADSQTVIAAVQYSEGRSQVDGPWSFLIIQTGADVELIQNPYGTNVLHAFRPAGAQTDFIVVDSVGGEQGEDRHFARVLTMSSHTTQVITTLGIAEISDCDAPGQTGHVADKIFYSYALASGLAVQSRQHYFQECGNSKEFRQLPSDAPDAEEALMAVTKAQSVSTNNKTANEPVAETGAHPDESDSSQQMSSCDQIPYPDGKRTGYAEEETNRVDAVLKDKGLPLFIFATAGPESRTLLVAAGSQEALQESEYGYLTHARLADLCAVGFSRVRFVLAQARDGKLVGASIIREVSISPKDLQYEMKKRFAGRK